MNKELTLQELQPLILEWAKEKDLLHAENAPKQHLKLIEECGELASAILKNDVKLQKDALGDVFVVLIILSEQEQDRITYFESFGGLDDFNQDANNIIGVIHSSMLKSCQFGLWGLFITANNIKLDLTECANIAWNEIKDRTGITVDGTFIKD